MSIITINGITVTRTAFLVSIDKDLPCLICKLVLWGSASKIPYSRLQRWLEERVCKHKAVNDNGHWTTVCEDCKEIYQTCPL